MSIIYYIFDGKTWMIAIFSNSKIVPCLCESSPSVLLCDIAICSRCTYGIYRVTRNFTNETFTGSFSHVRAIRQRCISVATTRPRRNANSCDKGGREGGIVSGGWIVKKRRGGNGELLFATSRNNCNPSRSRAVPPIRVNAILLDRPFRPCSPFPSPLVPFWLKIVFLCKPKRQIWNQHGGCLQIVAGRRLRTYKCAPPGNPEFLAPFVRESRPRETKGFSDERGLRGM